MKENEWKEDKPIKRPIDEIEIPHPDGRRANAGETIRKRIDFGWEGPD